MTPPTPPFLIAERLPGAPEKYSQRGEGDFRRRLELLLRRSADAVTHFVNNGSLLPRRVVNMVLNPDVSGIAEGEITLEYAGTVLLLLRCHTPGVWFRLYASAADRTADAGRINDGTVPSTPIIVAAYFTSPDNNIIRLSDGDVMGVLAFNWNEPAKQVLYYRANTPTTTGNDYSSGVFTGPDNTPLSSLYPFEHTSALDALGHPRYRLFTEMSGFHPFFPGVFSGFSSELNIARKTGIRDHNGLRSDSYLWRVPYDQPYAALHCYFVGDAAGWDSAGYLACGVERDTAGSLRALVTRIDTAGLSHVIGSKNGIPIPIDTEFYLTTEIKRVAGTLRALVYTAPSSDPAAKTLHTSVVVPDAVQVPDHKHVGFILTRFFEPEAPLGYAAFAMRDYDISLPESSVEIALGYVPIEVPGGELGAIE